MQKPGLYKTCTCAGTWRLKICSPGHCPAAQYRSSVTTRAEKGAIILSTSQGLTEAQCPDIHRHSQFSLEDFSPSLPQTNSWAQGILAQLTTRSLMGHSASNTLKSLLWFCRLFQLVYDSHGKQHSLPFPSPSLTSALPGFPMSQGAPTALRGYDGTAWQDASGTTRIWTRAAVAQAKPNFHFISNEMHNSQGQTQPLWGSQYKWELCKNDNGKVWKVVPPASRVGVKLPARIR